MDVLRRLVHSTSNYEQHNDQVNMRRFTTRPEILMAVIGSTSSVFSGSQVLRFVDSARAREDWEAQDLDIYTTAPKGNRLLMFFQEEGYIPHILPSGQGFERPYVDDSAIACVVRLRKGEESVVDVVFSCSPTALHPITLFHSTIVVNFITAYEICIAYPEATFAGRGYRRPWASRTTTYEAAIDKYKARGYAIETFASNVEDTSHLETARFYCPHTIRSFTDEGIFRIPIQLPQTTVAEERHKALMRSVTWKWGGYECACCDQQGGQKIRIAREAVPQ